MRISDWSSDVCSSDLAVERLEGECVPGGQGYRCLRRSRKSEFTKSQGSFLPGSRSPQHYDAPTGAAVAGACWSVRRGAGPRGSRSEEHTSELQSLMRISYAVFCLKKKKKK